MTDYHRCFQNSGRITMDHPNAIYFIIAANLWLAVIGGLFVAGSVGRGPTG